MAKKVWASLGVEQRRTSPYHPQTNGQAETFNRTVKRYLMTAVDNKSVLDWESHLPALMLSYNTAIHRTIGMAPFHAVFGYDPNTPLWDAGDIWSGVATDESDGASQTLRHMFESRDALREQAQDKTEASRLKYKRD